jgi:hypothetical protein
MSLLSKPLDRAFLQGFLIDCLLKTIAKRPYKETVQKASSKTASKSLFHKPIQRASPQALFREPL